MTPLLAWRVKPKPLTKMASFRKGGGSRLSYLRCFQPSKTRTLTFIPKRGPQMLEGPNLLLCMESARTLRFERTGWQASVGSDGPALGRA